MPEVPDMKSPLRMTAIATLALAATLGLHASSVSSQTPPALVPVLVALKGNWRYEGDLRATDVSAQRAEIARVQARVIEGIQAETGRPGPTTHARLRHAYATVPGLALEIRAEVLDRLQRLPDVAQVYEDRTYELDLNGTTDLVGSRLLNDHQVGVDGGNQVVAIIDSGVHRDHPFLGESRFVANACFSYSNAATNSSTLCPNGEEKQFGGTSGEDCTVTPKCDHGTHVAGIAGGFTDTNGNGQIDRGDRKGVAPRVKFITIQVFHAINDADACDPDATPCVRSKSSDVIGALDRVSLLRDDHPIAAANLSLGSGRFTDRCDSGNPFALEAWIVASLRSRATATVASAGNKGFRDSMGSPACVTGVISVGNTTNRDVVNAGSNTSPLTSLVAPGTSVNSSVPLSAFGDKTGTSMAAPHVTGAWALMKQDRAARGQSTSVSAILDRLRATGVPVTRDGQTFPRVDVVAALDRKFVEVATDGLITVGAGQQVIRPVTLVRRNFGGPLRLTGTIFGGNPSHINASFSDDPVLQSATSLGVSTAQSAGGTYALMVSGTADQVTFFGAPVQVSVVSSTLALASLTFSQMSVTGGTSLTATATLTGPTPSQGLALQVSNSSPSASGLPSSFTVTFLPVAGQAQGQATFTVPTRAVHADTSVTFAAGSVSGSFLVRAPHLESIAIAPQLVASGAVATATATLNGPAAASGSPTTGAAFTAVATSSSSPTVASVSGTALVQPSFSATSFPVTAGNISVADCATITGTLGTQALSYIGVSPSQASTIGLGPTIVFATTLVPATITLENRGVLGQPPVTYALTSSRANFTLSRTQAGVKSAGSTTFTVTAGDQGCAMVTATAGGQQRSVLVIATYPNSS
jgi:hypothetical protein